MALTELSAYAKQQMLRMETQAMFPYLVEITVPNDTENEIYRYANTSEDVIFEDNTYTASCFKITPPEKTESTIKDAKITISAIDNFWIEKIRETSTRCSIRFVAIIQYEKDNSKYIEKIDDINFMLTNASWTESTIEWTMKFDDRLDVKVPCQKLSSFICPALF